MVGLTKLGKVKVDNPPSRKQKVAAEIVKRHQSGTDPVATSFTQKMFDKVMSPNPQKTIVASPNAFGGGSLDIKQSRKEFQKEQGLPVDDAAQVRKLNVKKSKRIADAFEELKHNPSDPKVRSSYNAMIKETESQYQKLLDSGVKFEYWRGKGEPYKDSKEMLHDLRENKTLKVLATEGNFGQKNITPEELAENPLLRRTRFNDVNGQPLLANDVFRAVHDAFGHAEEGYSFGAVGEEGAWASHIKMYSPEARLAVTTETRGQNSWVNFGKQLRRPDGTIPQKGDVDYIPPQDRPFGEQKVGLLPEEFSMDEYVSLWKDPKFRERAKKGGFSAATIYMLTNSDDAEGNIVTSVLLKVGDNVITKFDARKSGEMERIRNLQTQKTEQNLIEEQPFDWEQHYGEGGLFTMSDRLSAGETLEGVNDVVFVDADGNPDPVYLGGGQNFMRDPKNVEKGDIWAAGEGAVSGATNKLAEIEKATGKPPLLAAWRMGESSSVEFAVPTTETGIKYARQVMGKRAIQQANKKIRESVPTFKGLSDPQTILDLKDMSGDQRKAIIHILDRDFRNRGSLSRGEMTASVSDAMQLGKDSTAIQNVGTANLQIGKSTSPSYPDAFGGVYTGTDSSNVSAVDLIPDAAMAKYPKISREKLKKSTQPLQMTPDFYTFKINDEFLEKLQDSKTKGIEERRIAREKAADHINNTGQEGKVDWKYLSSLGFGSVALTVISTILASPEAQANIFASGVKSALNNIPMEKASPQQFKAMLAKQKGVAGKEINFMDWDSLGNKSVTKEQVADFIDAEAPKIVMAEKREVIAKPLTEAEEWSKGAMQIGHDLWYSGEENLTALDFLDSIDEADYDGLRKEMFDELVNNGGMTPESANYEIDNVSSHLLNIKPSTIEKLIDKGSVYDPHWYHDKQPDYVPDMGSDGMDDIADSGKMEYSQYSLEGGENYREIYFNLDGLGEPQFTINNTQNMPPIERPTFNTKDEAEAFLLSREFGLSDSDPRGKDLKFLKDQWEQSMESMSPEARKHNTDQWNKTLERIVKTNQEVRHGHMRDQPNNMAWARVTERTGENGEKILQIEEIQSDARGNKQLKKMLPNNWREGVLNKVMETAQAEGFDGVTFSKTANQVNEIEKWDSMQQGNNSYLVSPDGKRKLTDQDSALSEFMSLDEALEDAVDDIMVYGNHLEKLKKRRDIDVVANEGAGILDGEQLAGMNRSIERMKGRLEKAQANKAEYQGMIDSGYKIDRVSEEVFTGGEGQQRVVDQYTKEMPEMAKKITGEDVGTINVDGYDLNYIPLTEKVEGMGDAVGMSKYLSNREWDSVDDAKKNIRRIVDNDNKLNRSVGQKELDYDEIISKIDFTEEGGQVKISQLSGKRKKKIRESKFWSAAPVVGAAGLAATGSDETMANIPDRTEAIPTSREDALRNEQRKALKSIDFNVPEGINTLEDYEAAYERGEIDSHQFQWVMDQTIPDSVLPDSLVSEEVVEENSPAITTPQEQERKAVETKPDIMKPMDQKIGTATEEELPLLYTPPEQMPEGSMSNADRYNKQLERQSWIGRGKRLAGTGEVAMTVGSGMLTEMVAGLGGAGVGFRHNLADGLERRGLSDLAAQVRPNASAAQTVEGLQESAEAGIYMPRGDEGQQQLQAFGETVGQIGEYLSQHGGKEAMESFEESQDWLNVNVGGVFGKEAGAVAATIPRVALELI